MVSVVIFTSIGFLPSLTRTSLSYMHCSVKPSLRRNHPHRRTTIAISPVIGTAPIDVDHDLDRADRRRLRSSKSARLRSRSRDRDRRDCDRDLADRDRADCDRDRDRDRSDRDRDLTENTICPSGFSHREIDLFFWVLFEFLGMNDIMCLFGS